ncbi:MAG: methionyl-tRNA formyltransferase, partial [Candidatus Margulisbacteria bacterium]|nr:methionyl-tRNA formyltransferase [Candidatus Margulisiibacteriota bacterium]
RGAAPIQWALLNGEKETGITIMKIDELLDTGEIILQQKVRIEEADNTITLTKKLFAAGGKLLIKAIKQIAEGKATYTAQNNTAATNAPAIAKESGEIDWRKSAAEIHNRIRAMVPWPAAHTFYHGKRLKLLSSQLQAVDLAGQQEKPGAIVQIVKNLGFIVRTGKGDVLVREVQLEGKRPVGAYNFVIGHDVKIHETLPN